MGVLCVDFSKAFDSVEHFFIDNTLAFFKYGLVMRKMVVTILNNRVSCVVMGEDIGGKINIQRGTVKSGNFVLFFTQNIFFL